MPSPPGVLHGLDRSCVVDAPLKAASHALAQDDWFDRNVQEVVIRERFLSEELLHVFDTKATILPPCDPMMSDAD
jgi:aminopeptidase C